jgi:hypothetical protein
MPKPLDVDARALILLQAETTRMAESAERVRLVIKAMALRRGLRVNPTEIAQEDTHYME